MAQDTASTTINVVLADDHQLLLAGFTAALSGYNIDVIRQSRNPQEAVALYTELTPDVLVLDIRFGERLTGFDAAKEVLKQRPEAKIVFLSQFDQDNLIREAYRVGGKAFVPKSAAPEVLAEAIRHASKGDIYFLPEIAERLAIMSVKGVTAPLHNLDSREIEVFTLMAQGLTNQEIADRLSLSLRTISNVSQAIKEKLGLHRAADITLLAVKYALIQP